MWQRLMMMTLVLGLLSACARPEVTCPLPSPVTVATEHDITAISTPLARWLLAYDEVCP